MPTQIIINRNNTQPQMVKPNQLQDVKGGKFFNEFVESQKVGYRKPDGSIRTKGITPEGASILRAETIDILNHCNPHNAINNKETTHLVVGYVQSGKTLSFTALTALALDNGYRMVVYLAGTKKNLLNQTDGRLEDDLVKINPQNNDFYKIHKDPTTAEASSIIKHLKLSSKPIILIPVLKHYQHINNISEIFSRSDFKHLMQNEIVLIIDDEADQASLNSFGRKNSTKSEEDEKQSSSTYAAILKMRSELKGNTYIQYTATPQANILISMQDMLSPKSHTLLTPGEGYIGGKLFFGRGANHDLFNGGLILNIPPDQVFHKKELPLKSMPKSLRDAMMLHVLATAIVVKYLQVEGVKYLSMMVHVDTTKAWNKKFKKWIDTELDNWSNFLEKPDGYDEKEYLLQDFEKLFPKAVQFYSDEDEITFDKIRPFISDVINDSHTYLVNTDKDAETKIDWDKYSMHILVGAEMLNRGFTVEKLATTYMPRYSTSVTNADTIQQRCRFFGYKYDYIKSCKVFLPQQSIANYMEYINHEEELRSVLSSCDSLVEAERKLMLSKNLNPCRMNVLPKDVVRTKMTGISSLRAYDSANTIKENNETIGKFLKQHQDRLNELQFGETEISNSHRGFMMSIEEAIDFLSEFKCRNLPDAMRKTATIRYLRYLSSIEDNPISEVCFIQMAYKAENENKLRQRPLDTESGKLTTALLQGASTTYLGDSYMVDTNTITIQLHHIKFKNRLPMDFPNTAYTIAINYPDSLSTLYFSSLESVFGEAVDDED